MITDLRLQQFRSYLDDSFEFSPGVNIVVGPNASGKTNLLEAILVLARGSSYRARDAELISFDKPWARLDANLASSTARTVKIVAEPLSKVFELTGKTYKRLSLEHSLPVVLFEPNHLLLLSGSPERRRNYLDDLLEQTTPGYSSVRRQYKRALAQRNNLLKQGSRASATLAFPWNVRLSQLAGQIVRARSELTAKIEDEIGGLYRKIAKTKTAVSLHYDSRWQPDSYESHLLKKLETDLGLDRQRGFTAAGPHREDLSVLFDGHAASEVASRGEIRTTVLALKIIELKLLETVRGTTPLLLLDDVFSELDGRRRHTLTDHLTPYQTFITTTDADAVVEHFTKSSHIIPLN